MYLFILGITSLFILFEMMPHDPPMCLFCGWDIHQNCCGRPPICIVLHSTEYQLRHLHSWHVSVWKSQKKAPCFEFMWRRWFDRIKILDSVVRIGKLRGSLESGECVHRGRCRMRFVKRIWNCYSSLYFSLSLSLSTYIHIYIYIHIFDI